MAADTTERSTDRKGSLSASAEGKGLFHGRLRRPSMTYAVWYLRIAAWLNLLGAIFVSFGNTVRQHNSGDYFTPYSVTAGYSAAAFTAFLAITLGRRKRAAWIFNLILLTPTAALYIYALFFDQFHDHAFNWCSAVVTTLLWLALLFGRREFYAKGDRNNPKLAAGVLLGGAAVSVSVGVLLVTAFGTVGQSSLADRAKFTLARVATLAGDDEAPNGLLVPHWVGIIINLMILA